VQRDEIIGPPVPATARQDIPASGASTSIRERLDQAPDADRGVQIPPPLDRCRSCHGDRVRTPVSAVDGVWAEKSPITSCKCPSCAIARKPSTASWTIGRDSRINGGSPFNSPASRSADQRGVAAVT
jgi:hypothetical protein